MSRYEPIPKDQSLTIGIGWDPPLQTYFITVGKEDCDDFDLELWKGTNHFEILSLKEILHLASPYTDDFDFAYLLADERQVPRSVVDQFLKFSGRKSHAIQPT